MNSSNRMLKVGPHSYTILLLFLELPPKKKKLGKNPDVDTSFLPDRDREVWHLLVLQVMLINSHKLQQSRVMEAESYTSPKSGGPQILHPFLFHILDFRKKKTACEKSFGKSGRANKKKSRVSDGK